VRKIAISVLIGQMNLFKRRKKGFFSGKNKVNTYLCRPNLPIMSNRTFTMIKPDATAKGYTGGILDQILQAGFTIKAMKWTRLTPEQAGKFYAVHSERPFYGELVSFMSSGNIVAAILEKDNAVADFRKLIGATNPAQAEEGTIRKKYAASVGENAVHGSDSDENAAIEGNFYFSELERF
jgi:nucleoside-diphosphate kinase